MMVIYHYDKTGEYIGPGNAKVDPGEYALGNEIYLIPANATAIKPPETGENQAAVWNGIDWEIVADYRGQPAYRKSDAMVVDITDLGNIDDSLTLFEPCAYPIWDNDTDGWIENTDAKNQARIAEIKSELSALDVAAVRPLRAIAAGSGTENDTAKISELEAQAQSLRALLNELTEGAEKKSNKKK